MQAERRLAYDGHPYTYAKFWKQYGHLAHSFWFEAPLAQVEPTFEHRHRQRIPRAAQPGDQRASEGFAVPVRSAVQPPPLPMPNTIRASQSQGDTCDRHWCVQYAFVAFNVGVPQTMLNEKAKRWKEHSKQLTNMFRRSQTVDQISSSAASSAAGGKASKRLTST